jgi:hypothetical protein
MRAATTVSDVLRTADAVVLVLCYLVRKACLLGSNGEAAQLQNDVDA